MVLRLALNTPDMKRPVTPGTRDILSAAKYGIILSKLEILPDMRGSQFLYTAYRTRPEKDVMMPRANVIGPLRMSAFCEAFRLLK